LSIWETAVLTWSMPCACSWLAAAISLTRSVVLLTLWTISSRTLPTSVPFTCRFPLVDHFDDLGRLVGSLLDLVDRGVHPAHGLGAGACGLLRLGGQGIGLRGVGSH
jgi:hypothetical protein